MQHEFFLDTSIEELLNLCVISKRTYNSLTRSQLNTLGEVDALYRNPEDLLKIRNFGPYCMAEIKNILPLMVNEKKPMKPLLKVELNDDAFALLLKMFYRQKECLSRRCQNFIENYLPSPAELLQCLQENDLNGILPREKKGKTVDDTILFLQKMREEQQRLGSLSQYEICRESNRIDFPFLNEEEQSFLLNFQQNNGHLPMFFLLLKYLRQSSNNSDHTYALRYGIIDNRQRSMAQLAEEIGISAERVRQLCSSKKSVEDTSITNHACWSNYEELFHLPLLHRNSEEWKIINENEQLHISFETFAALIMIVADFSLLKFVRSDNWYIIINSNYDNVDIKEPVNRLRKIYDEKRARVISENINDILPGLSKSAIDIISRISKEVLGYNIDESGVLQLPQNSINIPEELYDILYQNGQPMHIKDLFKVFKNRYPEHKYTDFSQIKHSLYQHPQILPIGKSSQYALKFWDDIYFGSIRNLLIDLLDSSDIPMHIDDLMEEVNKFYPHTSKSSVMSTMVDENKVRFKIFGSGYYGLSGKNYGDEYIESQKKKQLSFEERLENFKTFVERHKRLPTFKEDTEEAPLARWYYNVTMGKSVKSLSDSQKSSLEKLIDEYNRLEYPFTSIEADFLENCNKLKTYLQEYNLMPTRRTCPSLHDWILKSRRNYKTFTDKRKLYWDNLAKFAYRLGFII